MNENTQQRTVTINAYTVTELKTYSPAAYNKAHSKHVEFVWASYGSDLVEEWMRERLQEERPTLGALKFNWRLSHCQGDGVSFTSATLTDEQLRELGVEPEQGVEFSIVNNDFEHSFFDVEWYSDSTDGLTETEYGTIEAKKRTLEEALRQVCRMLEKAGYSQIECLECEECFESSCEEFLFDGNGRIVE